MMKLQNLTILRGGLTGATDPSHYTVNHYDKTRKRLYIYYEIQMLNLSNRKAVGLIKKENI